MKQFKKNLAFFIFLFLILIFFGKKIIPDNGSFICGSDIELYFAWVNQFIKEEFLAGRMPLWNPYNCCGVPLAPHWIFYPTTLFYVLLPLPLAFNLDTLLHLCIGAMGIYWFVRHISGSFFAGLCAGVVYGLSGYFIDRIYAGHQLYLYTSSLLPWLFFFVEKSFHERRFHNLSFAGIVLGLQILSGDIQNAYYAAMFVTIFYFLRMIFCIVPAEKIKKPFKKISAFVVLPIVSFGIGALQILPSYELLSLSLRSEKTYKFATLFSFPPENFFTFLVPKNAGVINTNWEFTCYIGILGLMLAILGLLFSQHRRMVRIMAMMSIFTATVMLGHYTPFYKLYYVCIPGITNFRLPCRIVIMMVFSLSVLAGLGASHLDSSKLTRKYYLVMGGLALALGGTLFWGAGTFGILFSSSSFRHACILLAGGLIALFSFSFLKRIKMAHIVIIGMLFLDLYLCFAHTVPVKNIQNIFRENSFETFLKIRSPMDRVMLPLQFTINSTVVGFGGARAIGHRYFDANGYVMVLMKDYVTYIQEMAGLSDRSIETHLLNDPALFENSRVFSSRILNIKHAVVPINGKYQMVQTNNVFPRACIVHDAIFLPDITEHLSYLKNPEFDPRAKALFLSRDKEKIQSFININMEGKLPIQPERESMTEIVEYLPTHIELRADSSQDGFLILSEIFYPGWLAYIDGKKVPVFKADYLLRGVPLTKGRHHIKFVYRPLSFILGGGITVATLLFLLIMKWPKLNFKLRLHPAGRIEHSQVNKR